MPMGVTLAGVDEDAVVLDQFHWRAVRSVTPCALSTRHDARGSGAAARAPTEGYSMLLSASDGSDVSHDGQRCPRAGTPHTPVRRKRRSRSRGGNVHGP